VLAVSARGNDLRHF